MERMFPEDSSYEAVARFMATRLAITEQEIAELASIKNIGSPGTNDFYVRSSNNGHISVSLRTDEIEHELPFGINKEWILFTYDPARKSNSLQLVDINTNYTVSVGMYTDMGTRDDFFKFAREAHSRRMPNTKYFFSLDGGYRKLQFVTSNFDSGKTRIFDNGDQQGLESDMTPEDFELAGAVLSLLKRELTQGENELSS